MILILLAFLLLFGPSKLPEMARSVGKAVGEFRKAQNEAEREFRKAQMEAGHDLKDSNKPTDEKDSKIHDLAVEMGLDVQNKTTEQLIEEIRMKIKSNESLPPKAEGA